jgi:hypothetical protein
MEQHILDKFLAENSGFEYKYLIQRYIRLFKPDKLSESFTAACLTFPGTKTDLYTVLKFVDSIGPGLSFMANEGATCNDILYYLLSYWKDFFTEGQMIISDNIIPGKINDFNDKGKEYLYHMFNTIALYIAYNASKHKNIRKVIGIKKWGFWQSII